MRRGLIFLGLPLALVLAGLWLSGGFAGLMASVEGWQRQAQEALAGAVRALRGGEPGAWGALLGVCFTYGVLHAAGPGHGKALIGAYGVARRVPVLRLSVLALVSALAQAAVAVALVYALVAVLGLTRDAATGLAEGAVPAFGNALIAGLGLWLVWRGVRGCGGRRLRRILQLNMCTGTGTGMNIITTTTIMMTPAAAAMRMGRRWRRSRG